MKSYKDLDIYKESFSLAVTIRMESNKLSKPDRFEVGSQIRRSSQSIKDNIVEGYGRRKYKADFLKHLIYAQASLIEARSQAQFVFQLYQNPKWEQICKDLDILGSKLHNFIKYVERNWR